MKLARLKVEKLSGKLPDPQVTGASGLSDTVLVPPNARKFACKGDVVNVGVQSHAGAAKTFYPNARTASLQPCTTVQFYGLSQPINTRDRGVTWVTNTGTTFTNPLIPNRSITSTNTSGHVTSTCLQIPTTTCLKLDSSPLMHHHGKAPPIDEFMAEDKTITFDDWLPIPEHAAAWNGWSKEESLM